jgi:hypothetical protein
MDIIDKAAFAFDPMAYIRKLVTKWNPSDCKSEKDYENSLYRFLHQELSDVQITKQYAVGRVKADLLIGEKTIVELKLNLTKRDQFQRLVGQLEEYKEWKGRVILILIGDTEPNFRKQLKKISEDNAKMFEPSPTIIDKD